MTALLPETCRMGYSVVNMAYLIAQVHVEQTWQGKRGSQVGSSDHDRQELSLAMVRKAYCAEKGRILLITCLYYSALLYIPHDTVSHYIDGTGHALLSCQWFYDSPFLNAACSVSWERWTTRHQGISAAWIRIRLGDEYNWLQFLKFEYEKCKHLKS